MTELDQVLLRSAIQYPYWTFNPKWLGKASIKDDNGNKIYKVSVSRMFGIKISLLDVSSGSQVAIVSPNRSTYDISIGSSGYVKVIPQHYGKRSRWWKVKDTNREFTIEASANFKAFEFLEGDTLIAGLFLASGTYSLTLMNKKENLPLIVACCVLISELNWAFY